MLTVRLAWGASGERVAEGRIVDLRKRGLVPLLGKLQGPGIVHDMAVRVRLHGDDARVVAIEPTMSAYPFAARRQTGGEACPQILPRVQDLVGVRLTEDYDAALVERGGGPRGCFHVFTLLRLLGPTIVAAAERDRERREAAASEPEPAAETPIFSRSIIVDGVCGDGMRLLLRGQLFDLDYVPGAAALPIEEEMAASIEATADVELAVPSMEIRRAAGRTRRGGPAIAQPGAWEPEPRMEQLVGVTMYKGYTAEVRRRFADAAGTESLQHLLFMLAPAMIQCWPSLMDEIEVKPRRPESIRGAVDSCHMWRTDGPLMHD